MSELKDYVLETSVINRNIVETLDEEGGDVNSFKILKVKVLNPNKLSYELVGPFIVDTVNIKGIIPFISSNVEEGNYELAWTEDKTYLILNPTVEQQVQLEVTTESQYNELLPYNDKENQVVLMTKSCILTVKPLIM